MTRKEYELVCKVLKAAPRVTTAPEAEYQRQHIGLALCEAFDLKGDAKVLFLQKAGLPSR